MQNLIKEIKFNKIKNGKECKSYSQMTCAFGI